MSCFWQFTTNSIQHHQHNIRENLTSNIKKDQLCAKYCRATWIDKALPCMSVESCSQWYADKHEYYTGQQGYVIQHIKDTYLLFSWIGMMPYMSILAFKLVRVCRPFESNEIDCVGIPVIRICLSLKIDWTFATDISRNWVCEKVAMKDWSGEATCLGLPFL